MPTQTFVIWDNANRNVGEYRSNAQPVPLNARRVDVLVTLEEADRSDPTYELNFGLEGTWDGLNWQVLAIKEHWFGGINPRNNLPEPNPSLFYETFPEPGRPSGFPLEMRGWIVLPRRTRMDLSVRLTTV